MDNDNYNLVIVLKILLLVIRATLIGLQKNIDR